MFLISECYHFLIFIGIIDLHILRSITTQRRSLINLAAENVLSVYEWRVREGNL